jgi:small subunit ribosomal protein S16
MYILHQKKKKQKFNYWRKLVMAVKIRLRRMGQKKAPFYRIIVADSRSPRDGKFIEEIGYYDPTQEPSVIKVDEEAAKKWLNNGAQPTEMVGKIFKVAGIEK